MSISVIVLLLLATLTFVVVGVGVLVKERDRRRSLAFVVDRHNEAPLERLRRTVERRVVRTRAGANLRQKLHNADITLPVADAVLVGVAGFGIILFVSFGIGGPILSIVCGLLAMQGVRLWFRRREERRFTQFIDQLPDLARLLANATSAGLSLRAGLAVAAQETAEPTKGELEKVNKELALGASLEDSLERMGDRLPSRELAVLVNVLVIQSRAGGRIVTALQGITEALEVRRDVRREVATLISGSKATVMAVSVMGAGMVLLVHSTVEGGLRALLENPIGLGIFLVSLALFIVGTVLVRRVVNVEV